MVVAQLVPEHKVFWGTDQHFQICQSLGTLGELDWQKPLSTKHWQSELHGEVPSGYVGEAAALASLDLAMVFEGSSALR